MKLFKKYISKVLFIIILSCLLSFNVDAVTFGRLYDKSGNILCLYNIQDNEVTITSAGQLNDIIIPEYIEGYPVTKINKWAMFMNDNYTSVTLPETLVTIEDEAIANCKNIKYITVPKSVTKIGNYAIGYKVEGPPHCTFYTPYKDTIIRGYKGTAAETYAKHNGFEFVALDDEPQVTTATTITTQTTTTSTTVSTTTTSKATTETTKATTSTTLTTTTSATTVTTNSTTTISTSASTTASSTSISTTTSATSISKDTTTNLTTPLTTTSTSVTTSETTSITTTHVKGDANGDNKLDVRDAAFIAQKIALDKAVELPKCADFNEDGTVNVRDAAAIARYFASRKR